MTDVAAGPRKPLAGIHIVELAGIGPAPFAGMMLADHGARVTYVHRPGAAPNPRDPLLRGREMVAADLKDEAGIAAVRALLADADGLIEGFRPGVLERLGLAPAALRAVNPRLVIGRMTGWGQDGPLAQSAGHDLNYLALSGTLSAIGRPGSPPPPPLNLIGDFGGGGMMLAFGMTAALLDAARSGQGSVIDCAMTDGAALLATMIWGFRETFGWQDKRAANILDGGAHFYDCYETADGGFVALGAIEPQFYAAFRAAAGLSDDTDLEAQFDRTRWAALKDKLTAVFAMRTRDEWVAAMTGVDACLTPVLSMAEAPHHPHNAARGSFVHREGVTIPAPAPRFSD